MRDPITGNERLNAVMTSFVIEIRVVENGCAYRLSKPPIAKSLDEVAFALFNERVEICACFLRPNHYIKCFVINSMMAVDFPDCRFGTT